MSEVVVIAPVEMVAALRMAGIAALPARNATEAFEQVQEVRSRSTADLVVMPEHLLAGLGPQPYREVLDCDQPYCVPLPLDWQAAGDARTDFEARLGRILGCRVNLSALLRRRREGGAKV